MAHEHAQTNRRPAQKDNVILKQDSTIIKGSIAKQTYVVSQILTLWPNILLYFLIYLYSITIGT